MESLEFVPSGDLTGSRVEDEPCSSSDWAMLDLIAIWLSLHLALFRLSFVADDEIRGLRLPYLHIDVLWNSQGSFIGDTSLLRWR